MEVIADTREQKPLFKISECSRRLCLFVGDYTTENLWNIFHVERKSAPDLYSTITKGHVRFRNEIIRAEFHNIKLVMVVECNKSYFINKEFYGGKDRKIKSDTLKKIISTIEKRYGLRIYWCKDRAAAKRKITQLLKYEESIRGKSNGYSRKNKSNKGKQKSDRSTAQRKG